MADPKSATEGERILSGRAASGHICVGTLNIQGARAAPDRQAGDPAAERKALDLALERAGRELQTIVDGADTLAGEILEFQAALLEDDDLIEPVRRRVAHGEAWHLAWGEILDGEIAEYRAADDQYMAARADDLVDLRQRVLGSALDSESTGEVREGDILIVGELTPSQFLALDWSKLAGVAVTGGSPTSHVAILARARGVNLLVGLEADLSRLRSGLPAVLDLERSRLVISPEKSTLTGALARVASAQAARAAADQMLHRPARTSDGRRIEILINVDDPSMLATLSPGICDGIGLTRTEFLFQGSAPPDEAAQYAAYRRILEWADGAPVTIRTLDAGGDKPIPGITVEGETNPFLGVRGVRLSLRRPDLLKTQLRALLRAARHGQLKIMIPMVTVPGEIEAVRTLLEAARLELDEQGLAHGPVELGMMIEVPAAALTAEEFDVDFYSIGSNDLIQYTTASARDNPQVADLAEARNPAVLGLIGRVVVIGHRLGRPVSLCGDMASTPELIASLLDQGLECLSVAPAQAAAVKQAVSRYNANDTTNGSGDG